MEVNILLSLFHRELPLHQQKPLAIEPSGHECPVRATTCQVCVKSLQLGQRVCMVFLVESLLIFFPLCAYVCVLVNLIHFFWQSIKLHNSIV